MEPGGGTRQEVGGLGAIRISGARDETDPRRSGFTGHGDLPEFHSVARGDVEPEWRRRNSGPEFNRELQGTILIIDFNFFVLGLYFNLVPFAEGDRGSLLRGDGLRSVDEAAHANGAGAGLEKDAPVVSGVNIADDESEARACSDRQSKLGGEFGRFPGRGVEAGEGFPRRSGPQNFFLPDRSHGHASGVAMGGAPAFGCHADFDLRETQFELAHRVRKIVRLDADPVASVPPVLKSKRRPGRSVGRQVHFQANAEGLVGGDGDFSLSAPAQP